MLGLVNNALPFALIAWGQTRLPSGLASILNASTPLFTVIVAHLMTSGRAASQAARSSGPPRPASRASPSCSGRNSRPGQTGVLAAEIAVLGAALCYAFASVLRPSDARSRPRSRSTSRPGRRPRRASSSRPLHC